MAIKVGEPAPDFTLKTQDNQDWNLTAQKGKVVVLLWYPLDWSPTCTTENCQVSQDRTLYGPDRVVVGISRDSKWSHKAYKDAKHIDHDLLEDMDLRVTKIYDLVHNKVPSISHRATVIIDKEGCIASVMIQPSTGEVRDMEAVRAELAKLK